MKIIDGINELRKKYLIHRIEKVEIPKFESGEKLRKKLIFSGKVQRVGFRLETHEMGRRIGLNGWVRNRKDGNVEAEMQGEKEKIDYLIKHLRSLRRASVEDVLIEEISFIEDDREEFKIVD